MTITAVVIIPRARQEKNTKYANDGSYESVQAQLTKLAGKCFKRVQAMGLPMDFDDVVQELNMSYVKASRSWNPEGGAMFTTYCQTACLNNFNTAIAKMERDRREIGLVSVHDLVGGSEEGEDSADPMEYLHSEAASELDSPSARLDRAAEVTENLASLSPNARKLIVALLASERRSGESQQKPPKLREMALISGLKGDELRRVKVEILNKFGVQWF